MKYRPAKWQERDHWQAGGGRRRLWSDRNCRVRMPAGPGICAITASGRQTRCQTRALTARYLAYLDRSWCHRGPEQPDLQSRTRDKNSESGLPASEATLNSPKPQRQ